MAAKQSTTEDVPVEVETEPTACGIIMPISAIGGRSEKHWASVLQLLHRAIAKAGLEPINIWAGELTDRVSERIVGNIFAYDIVVADISELNPNVMFELGLRLASKKPTVVIGSAGGSIPFDIRDFHVISYPGDLNILDMEEFFGRIEGALQAKLKAYRDGTYEPFLGNVVVDVLSPESRAVPFNELILERIEDLSRQIARPQSRLKDIGPPDRPLSFTSFRSGTTRSVAFFTVPKANEGSFVQQVGSKYGQILVLERDTFNTYLAAVSIPPRSLESDAEIAAANAAKILGGRRGVPDGYSDRFS